MVKKRDESGNEETVRIKKRRERGMKRKGDKEERKEGSV